MTQEEQKKDSHFLYEISRKYCDRYIGVSCVDGSCPNAQEYENYFPISYKECFYYKGCEDCAASDFGCCPKEEEK